MGAITGLQQEEISSTSPMEQMQRAQKAAKKAQAALDAENEWEVTLQNQAEAISENKRPTKAGRNNSSLKRTRRTKPPPQPQLGIRNLYKRSQIQQALRPHMVLLGLQASHTTSHYSK